MMKTWVLVSAAGLLQISSAFAERYQVVEDRFGNLDAEISSEPAPAQKADSSEQSGIEPPASHSEISPAVRPIPSDADSTTVEVSPDSPTIPAQQTEQTEQAEVLTLKPAPVGDVDDRGSISPDMAVMEDEGEPHSRKLGKFERIFLENEGRNPYDATTIEDEDFVDADALLEGRADSPSTQPFFITRDPDGNENVTFYSPSLAKQAKAERELKLEYSKATVYKPGDTDGVYIGDLPEGADPIAVQILTAGKGRFENYFDSFSKRCCSDLPKTGVKTIGFGRSEHLRVLEESMPYRFNEGDSRYLIFKLPDSKENFAIQLRAFIKEFGNQDIEHGVFYPQIVMLDINLQPLRIIANPVLEFTPESWSNYGFLQGVFEVDRTEDREEVYVLLNTTKDALNKLSQYDYDEGRIVIQHMKYGELGVKAVDASELIQP